MSWSPNSRRVFAAGIALCAAGGVARADSLIVRSSGPSAKLYPPGRSLPDSARVALGAGDQLTLLDGRGTRTLAGPGAFSLAAGAATSATAANDTRLAAFLGRGARQRVRIGAVRGLNTARPHAPNLWNVDTSRGGTVCVADPAAVMLWRPDTASGATLAIAGPSGRASVAWTPGQAVAPWPAGLAVAPGAGYSLAWRGGAAPVSIRLKVLAGGGAGAAPGIEDTASELIRNGCSAQVDLLVDLMAVPGG